MVKIGISLRKVLFSTVRQEDNFTARKVITNQIARKEGKKNGQKGKQKIKKR
jgi:hypothetical protein